MAREEKMCNNNNHNNNSNENSVVDLNEDPTDFHSAQIMINSLRLKCRNQTERIMTWKKAFTNQEEQHFRQQKQKNDQLNSVTSQLLLLQSRLMRKQKQIINILSQRDLTIIRQQKIIDTLSTRLIDHGLDGINDTNGYNDFDSLNDSDSAVVLEDIDSDCNSSSLITRRKGSSDVTIIRSISDAIETNLKYSNVRRSNCFLRRPDILETVYSVEEDPEPGVNDLNEKRDKFKHRTEKIILDDQNQESQDDDDLINWSTTKLQKLDTINNDKQQQQQHQQYQQYCNQNSYNYNNHNKQSQVTNYNRVMSNHRSVTKPKDVKYKRINKAKSKSLEELRGKLRHWVEKGTNLENNLQQDNNKKTMMTNCYT